MTPEQLEDALRAWGYYMGQRPPSDDIDDMPDHDRTPTHALVLMAQFPPGKAGHRSAKAMARYRGTPSWGFDPMVCHATRSHKISMPEDTPPIVRVVQSAYLQLFGESEALAIVLLTHYQTRGTKAEKAKSLGLRFNDYNHGLSEARAMVYLLLNP